MATNLVDKTELEFDPRNVDYFDELTSLQNAYVYWRHLGFTPLQSARRAGYSSPKESSRENERNKTLKGILQQVEEEARVRYDVDRDRVIEGIMEALSVAREQSDPKVMLQAWVETARITGVQAPEVKKIEVQGEVTQHHITDASDKDLLEILGKRRELELPALEADYEVLEHDAGNRDPDGDLPGAEGEGAGSGAGGSGAADTPPVAG